MELEKSVIVMREDSDRRQGEPPAPLFGELLLEAEWQPEGPLEMPADGWLRAKGLVPERRQQQRRK